MPGQIGMQPGGWQNNQWQSQMYGQNGGIMQSPQQPEAQFVGRYIQSIDEVMPREVPMDGRAAIFPTQSLEEIYLKAWDRTGSIKTFRYILDTTQNLNEQGTVQGFNVGSQILERLDKLEQRLNDQSKASNNRRTNSKGGDEQ